MTSLAPRGIAQQIRDLPSEKRIIIAHPSFKAHHLVLSDVLENAVYVRLQGHNLDDAQLQAQFDAAIERQREQHYLDGRVPYLIVDESDRVAPAALARFLRHILDVFKGERIILLGRLLPDGLLDDEQIRRESSFIPTDSNQMLWDYAQVNGSILLEVRAFGDGSVHLNGKSVDSWDGALPRSLFFYLIDRGMVTRAEIFQTFWPTLSTREATNVFHVTKRKISEVLGTELTVYGSTFYHISPKIQLSYDVSLFNQLVQDADNAGTGEPLRQALALYHGDYLMSLNSPWVLSRRDSLQQSACDTLIALGKICESNSSPLEALNYYLQASRLKPEREDSTYATMRLYRDLEMDPDALQVYRRLVKTLRDKLKVAPSSQVQQLAAQLES